MEDGLKERSPGELADLPGSLLPNSEMVHPNVQETKWRHERPVWMNEELLTKLEQKRRHASGKSRERRLSEHAGVRLGKPKLTTR